MTPERWQEVQDLVIAALKHELDDRERFLDAECGSDGELRRQVRALLESYDQVETFMEAPAALDLARKKPTLSALSAPEGQEKIGPYRLISEIGYGGMGSVFLAARGDGEFEQRVAIKLIRPDIGSESVARRFRSERQILANLDHPHIARLLDGGTAEDGRPYFVMERIEGTRIDEYCDDRRSTLRQRLELFEQVCAAVAYAHRNLVVHRDLKPSNILVTEDGSPKLLDFGIAKLLDPSAFPHTVEATHSGLGPMTPPYASPEQILGQSITTASDVYSLGILLYKLLTGRLPFDRAGLPPQEIPEDLAREPTRPSVAVTLTVKDGPDGEPKTRIGHLRRLSSQQLRRRLVGDLDNIVLQALRREPERRYGSVEQLAADLRRHLEGLPVLARQASMRYRAGKFLRRHRLAATAAIAFLALITGAALQITRQRDLAEQQRDRAEQVSGALVDLFATLDPNETTGDSITAREILDRSVKDITLELKDQPRTQAAVQTAIGKVYRSLGLYDQALPLLENALEKRQDLLGEGHIETAESLYELGELYSFLRDARAETLHMRALKIRREQLGLEHTTVAQSLSSIGNYHNNITRDTAQAIPHLQQALAIAEKRLGLTHIETANILERLATSHLTNQSLQTAESLLLQALDILESALGPKHLRLVGILLELSWIHCQEGRYMPGETLGRRALLIQEERLGPKHPDLGNTLNGLAYCYGSHGDYPRARDLLLRSVEIERETHGLMSEPFATMVHNLAIVEFRMENYEQSEHLFSTSLEIREDLNLGKEAHPSTLNFLGRLGEKKGDTKAATEFFQRSLSISKTLISKNPQAQSPRLNRAISLCNLGDIYRKQKKLEEAKNNYTATLSSLESINAQIPILLFTRARALTHLGRVAEAKSIVTELHARSWETPDFLVFSRQYGYGPEQER